MTAEQQYDPFKAFNEASGSEVIDPYPGLAEQRRQGPVIELDPEEIARDNSITEGTLPEGLQVFGAFSFDAVSEVLLDGESYSNAGYAMVMGPVMGRTILEMDAPVHSRYRKLLTHAFSREAMARWEEQLVQPIIARFIDQFADGGKADLVAELTFPFPVHVIAGMLGLPEADLPQFHRWAVELISLGFAPERAMAASQSLRDYFSDLLIERRKCPGDDMMSSLATAELDGEGLSDEDIFSFLRLLLPAGAETTYRSSSNLLVGLLTHPQQLAALRVDESLVAQAIEEGLRWEAPLLGVLRVAVREREVCGVNIPAGALVMVSLAAANHDESRWDKPEQFDIFRPPLAHRAFAYGAHACMGTQLARMETRVMLKELFSRLPNLRLDPDAPTPEIHGSTMRVPPSIPVVFS